MLVIAHRGFSSQYTENTLVAFSRALELEVDAIELDIHQVGNEFLVFHDPYVNKLTNGEGRIFDMTFDQARLLQVKGEEQIPTLNEVASLIGDKAILNIEVKTLISVKDFVSYAKNLMKAYRCKVVVSSFDHPLLMAIKYSFTDFAETEAQADEVYPIEFAGLIAHAPFDHAKFASSLGVSIAATDWNTVNADFVEDAHKRDLKVWCYTVNHQETLLELQAMGVDGIFTDRPDWARKLLNQ
ncbi:glycerophosphodiester phosphodiesterase [Glaciecola sp. MF2-115]|uniref:glycerophosphodiester phosphodiesterase n=1 Tax=Glaciecola sp. MF2-115 TaxID=3384827 RepID=UPI0039A00CBB